MQNFHEHKLWQEAYVALMDIHEIVDDVESNEEVIEDLLDAAQKLAAKIADGLSRQDHRFGRQLVWDAVGLVAVTRTQLAVAWGRGIMDDATFKGLDDKYANLSLALQNYK